MATDLKNQERSLRIDFYEKKGGLKERLRVELAGLTTRGIDYNIRDYRRDEIFCPTKMYCMGYELYDVEEIQKFLKHYLLKVEPVRKPGITLYGELREGDLNKKDIASIIKACDIFPDVFVSIAFRNNKTKPDELVRKELESLGISCYIDHLDKEKLIEAYKESGRKKVNPNSILPSMVYNGKEITGLKNIIIGMNSAIDEVKSPKQNQLSKLDERRIKWWKEEIIARTTGMSHGRDVHEEENYPE